MARLIFGIDSADQGEIFIKGKKTGINSPRNAILAGMGFCSEDRKSEGIFPDLTVRENIVLALQGRNGIFQNITKKKQVEIADEMIKSLGIKTPNTNILTKQLSGGNQQRSYSLGGSRRIRYSSSWTSRHAVSTSGPSSRSWSSS